MDLVTRDQWGARRPKNRVTGSLTGPSTGHWNGPQIPVVDHSKCAAQVRGVQNFHMDSRGWSDIAYNFVICPHGYTFEGRGLNVINGANGTNTANRTSHAIMWLAGKDNPFTDAEKIEFRECVKYVDDNTMAPDSAVGHRDHKSTECPGNERYNWIHQGMPVSTPAPPSQPTPPIPSFEESTTMIEAFQYGKDLDTFSIDSDGNLETRYYQPGATPQWKKLFLAEGCLPNGGVRVVKDYNGELGRLDVFAQHPDGVGHAWYAKTATGTTDWTFEVLP
ncbi:MAG: hypothetical protein ABWY25_02150 [Paenisporosarcina sp.]